MPYLTNGVVYGLGRDKENRPIMVQNLRRSIDQGMDAESFTDLVEFMATYSLFHAMIPGKIETWTMILDGKDVGLFEFPLSMLAGAIQKNTKSFKLRLHSYNCVNIDWKLNAAAKFVWNFINPRIAQKIAVDSG